MEQQLSIEVQVEVQQDTKVQLMVKAQQRVMEMERQASKAVARRRCAILNKTTFLEKGIKILDPDRFMWTQMKQNYDKHVE
jgi:hypothetical protein